MARHEFGTGSDRVVVDTDERYVLTSDGRRITSGIEAVAGDTAQLRAGLAGVRGVVPDSMVELWGDSTRRKLVIFDGHWLHVYAIASPEDEEAAARIVDAINWTWPRTRPLVSPPPFESSEPGVAPTITPEMVKAARTQLAITYGLVFFVAGVSLILGVALKVPATAVVGLALGVLGFLIRRKSTTALGIAMGILAVDALLNLVASPSLWAGVGIRVAILFTMRGGFSAIKTLKQANLPSSKDPVINAALDVRAATSTATPVPGPAPSLPAAADAMAVLASDPTTSPEVLAAIAGDRPELRAAVAMNPATNLSLVGWLASLDDPVINAALDRRETTPARMPSPDTAPTPMATPAPMPVSAPAPVAWPVQGAAPMPVSAPAPVAWPVAGGASPARAKGRRGVLVGVAAGVLVLAGGVYLVTQLTDTTRPKTRLAATEVVDTTRPAATEVTATITVGNEPAGVAVIADTHTAYVTNDVDGTVSVIDTATNQVTATITVGSNPWEVAVDEAAHTAYVTNVTDDTVSVIDTATNEVTATIPVGVSPVGVAVDEAAHAAYVTSVTDGTVSVIDTATNEVTATIPVGGIPVGVAVDEARHTAYVTNVTDDTVSVIDTATNQVTASIPVGVSPLSVAVDEAAHTAYVTNNVDGTVSVIDTTTNQVTATIPVGASPGGVAVDEAAHTAYVTNNVDGTVSVIDTATNQVTGTITVGSNPRGMAVEPRTGTVYLTNASSGTVSVLQARGAAASQSTPAVTSTPVATPSPTRAADAAIDTPFTVGSEEVTITAASFACVPLSTESLRGELCPADQNVDGVPGVPLTITFAGETAPANGEYWLQTQTGERIESRLTMTVPLGVANTFMLPSRMTELQLVFASGEKVSLSQMLATS